MSEPAPSQGVTAEWPPIQGYRCPDCGDQARWHPSTQGVWGCMKCQSVSHPSSRWYANSGDKAALDACQQALDAERARGDAMRAAIAGTVKVEGVPGARMSSLVCFLEGIAESGNLFIERSMAELYAKHLRAALAIGENQPERSEP